MFVIIVAGGKGLRMGSDIPKQFLELEGLPVLMHTINRFKEFDKECQIIIPMPLSHIDYWKHLCLKYSFNVDHKLVSGGESRFHSVQNGLSAISSANGLVAVHDAVRPLVSKQTIKQCFEKAATTGNAVPVIDMVDSVRIVSGSNSEMLDRTMLKRIQTPQVFEINLLRKAYQQEYSLAFTDDASVVEKLGTTINLTNGNVENIKITEPIDLMIAEQLIKSIRPTL